MGRQTFSSIILHCSETIVICHLVLILQLISYVHGNWTTPPTIQMSQGYKCRITFSSKIVACILDFPMHLVSCILNSTYVTLNTVRAQVSASMSAHLMILRLILKIDLAINVNHVSTAQPLRETRIGWRREEDIWCWQICNAIELPDLRVFFIILICFLIILSHLLILLHLKPN